MKFNFKKQPNHRLVVMGDSLSQGFNNGGIYRTDLSFPAFLARAMNSNPKFEQPSFTAQAGLPINMEVLIRGLHDEFGDSLEWDEYLPAGSHLIKTLRRIKKYWEGKFKDLKVDRDIPFHNQSIWGLGISDSWVVNSYKCQNFVSNHQTEFNVFDMLPDNSMYTTAQLVLNPTFSEEAIHKNMLDNIEHFSNDGGIENLIICLGHNNIVKAVTALRFEWSEPDHLYTFPSDRPSTVSRPEHFELEYRALAERVSKFNAKNIFVPTIPYVTIPPVMRGVNSDLSSAKNGYFDFYTRFWVWDNDFNPKRHPFLTREESILLDQTVDEYNQIIRKVADEYGWNTVPVGERVAAIARRRLGGEVKRRFPSAFLEALNLNTQTSHLVNEDMTCELSTDYIRLSKETGKLFRGGIFSLDGLHPTTIGYGLMAGVYYEVMKNAGVKFESEMDWEYIISQDSLVNNPPILLLELRSLLRYLSMGRNESFIHLGRNLLAQIMDVFSRDLSSK